MPFNDVCGCCLTERIHVSKRMDMEFKPVDENVDVGGRGAEAMKEEGDEGDDHQDSHELPP